MRGDANSRKERDKRKRLPSSKESIIAELQLLLDSQYPASGKENDGKSMLWITLTLYVSMIP